MDAATADELLLGLDDEQRAAVTSPHQPLCVLAGAGSGKTRVLTRRIAWRAATGAEDPQRVLALTFTRAAAVELGARVRALGLRDGIRAGTFHAVAWAELRARAAERGRPAPVLLDRPARILAGLPGAQGLDRAAVADVANELAWLRARTIAVDDYPTEAARTGRRPGPGVTPERTAELAIDYERAKRRKGLVDFDDLLELLARALADDPGFAAAQRWRFANLYVDELQDLNPLQHRLLEQWRGDRPNLTAVGDPNQAIYGWNGSDPRFVERFTDHYPDGTVLAIDRSYRSTEPILDVANAILDGGRLGGVRLRSVRGDGPVPEVLGYADDATEGLALARAVLDAKVPGTSWGHQAVLARTNRLLDGAETALRAVGVPVRRHGQLPFHERPLVRATLRELTAPRADFTEIIAAIAARLPDADVVGATGFVGVDRDDRDEEQATLARLVELADRYGREHRPADAAGFRSWMLHEADDLPGGDGVDLVTFHGAKGREWPTVHVVGVEDGFVPIARSTGDALVEERRLFYVACTRAERRLRITWSTTRRFDATDADAVPSTRQPSPFLRELAPTLERLRQGDAPVPPPPILVPTVDVDVDAAAADAAAAVEAVATDTRVEALRSWRARRARAAGVAPTALLPDAVLARVAAAAPVDAASLAAIPGTRPLVLAGLSDEVLERLRG